MFRAAPDRCGEFVDACAVGGEIFKFSVSHFFTEAKLQLPDGHNGLSSNVCVAVVVLQQKGVRCVARSRSNGDKSEVARGYHVFLHLLAVVAFVSGLVSVIHLYQQRVDPRRYSTFQ